MKKLMIGVAAGALALTLAACGGTGNSSTTSSATSSVLKDTSGLALYSPAGETASNVRCTGACAAIWKPLRPGAAKLTGSSVITRPDGTKQVTVNGKPLYTFTQDAPGSVTGNGATDAFAGKQFTWHVVTSGGKAPAAPAMPTSGGY